MKYFYWILAGISAILFPACSCSTGEAAAQIVGLSSELPVFLGCRAVSERDIEFLFSLPVQVVSLEFSPALEAESLEGGSTVKVRLVQGPGPGEPVSVELVAQDAASNTITVLVPFRGRNTRLPGLLITELRTEYSNPAGTANPRSEFIEIKALSAGNLGAVRVYIAGNTKKPLVYEFAPVELKAGEYVVLHLRSIGGEACRDEYGSDLDLSGGAEALGGVRDFWIPGSAKLLHKTDAVYLLDQDGAALDAVMLAEETEDWWSKEHFEEAANMLCGHEAWSAPGGAVCGPAEAVNTAAIKTSATKSVSRDEARGDSNTAADWYITAQGGASPGKPNKP
jgi:hypothetical protein